MGSGSLKTVLGFDEWPYNKPVMVLSSSLSDADLPSHLKSKIEISQLSPDDLMAELGSRGHDRVYVDGGAIIRSFLRAGHIADMRITIAPVLIGEGIRMFGDLAHDLDLQLVDAVPFKSGLVDLRYVVT
ncbi:MAG: dihydrofolate reductase family protein, partial [Pseudomonadota bacterium]